MLTIQQQNEIIEVLCHAIAHKTDDRAIINFTGDHEGEEMLIDFSSCGEPYDDGTVCIWSLQKDIHDDEDKWGGTEELDWGAFKSYKEVFEFVIETLVEHPGTIHYECY